MNQIEYERREESRRERTTSHHDKTTCFVLRANERIEREREKEEYSECECMRALKSALLMYEIECVQANAWHAAFV